MDDRARYQFTLLELMFTVGLIGLAMGALVPGCREGHDDSRATMCLSQLANVGRTAAGINPYSWARPSSFHTNGFNAVFAAGNGRYMSDTIDPIIWAQLMSVDGPSAAWPRQVGQLRQQLVETVGPAGDYSAYGKPVDESSF